MSKPNFLSPPKITHGPSHAPLVAWLPVETENTSEIAVHISQNGDNWTIRFPVGSDLLFLGFHPDGPADVTVQLIGSEARVTWPNAIVHELRNVPTSALDIPPLQTHESQQQRMAGEFTFLTIRRRTLGRITDLTPAQRKWFTKWGMLIAVDNTGAMRWMRKLDRRAAGIERLTSGNLLCMTPKAARARLI